MMKTQSLKPNGLVGYFLATIVGVFVGLRISPDFIAVPYLLLAGIIVYYSFQRDVQKVLCLFPYLMYSEIFMRAYVLVVPYLFIQYLFIGVVVIFITQNSSKLRLHSKSAILYFGLLIVELVNLSRSDMPDIARALIINTIMMTVIVFWSCSIFLTPVTVYKILNHVKYASVYLCGIVMARYFMGNVEFSGVSGSEGINGLAPVQISGYLSFSCVVFFFSIMNEDKKYLLLNMILFSVSAIVMLLSFSRGGLYFVGIIMILYFYFNRKDVKKYFFFLLLVPCALLIYYYVTEATNGLIIDRYEQAGTSGRDELVNAGWHIFSNEPLTGVGLGNFNKEVLKRNLYAQEAGAHNEFIRVAAEDGILGVITYWGFFISLIIEIWKRRKIQREYALYFLALFCLISVHNGLKISIQPFLMLLAVATPSINYVKRKKPVPHLQKLSSRPA